MAWGFEWFGGLDVFSHGGLEFIDLFVFFAIFGYLVERGSSDTPLEDAIQILAYYFLSLLIMNFLGLPSVLIGLISIEIYLILIKYFSGMNMHKWIILNGYLWLVLWIVSLIPDSVRLYFTWFILVFNFALSQFRLNNKAKEPAKK